MIKILHPYKFPDFSTIKNVPFFEGPCVQPDFLLAFNLNLLSPLWIHHCLQIVKRNSRTNTLFSASQKSKYKHQCETHFHYIYDT